MPPKAKPSKEVLAKKQKVAEDKTFGLKNKNKSKNVQKYVQTIKQNVEPKIDPKNLDAKVPIHFSSFIDYSLYLNWFRIHLICNRKKRKKKRPKWEKSTSSSRSLSLSLRFPWVISIPCGRPCVLAVRVVTSRRVLNFLEKLKGFPCRIVLQ